MEYFCQHNGKGKTHLINDDFKLLCGSNGDFCFSDTYNLVIEEAIFYEKQAYREDEYKLKLSDVIVRSIYCSKCLKKALKK